MINKLKECCRLIKIHRADYILSQIPNRIDRNLYYQVRWMTGRFATARTNRAYRLMNYFNKAEE